jgi:hypothetical protein
MSWERSGEGRIVTREPSAGTGPILFRADGPMQTLNSRLYPGEGSIIGASPLGGFQARTDGFGGANVWANASDHTQTFPVSDWLGEYRWGVNIFATFSFPGNEQAPFPAFSNWNLSYTCAGSFSLLDASGAAISTITVSYAATETGAFGFLPNNYDIQWSVTYPYDDHIYAFNGYAGSYSLTSGGNQPCTPTTAGGCVNVEALGVTLAFFTGYPQSIYNSHPV